MKKIGIICTNVSETAVAIRNSLKEIRSQAAAMVINTDNLAYMQPMDMYVLILDEYLAENAAAMMYLRKCKMRSNSILMAIGSEDVSRLVDKSLPRSMFSALFSESEAELANKVTAKIQELCTVTKRNILAVDDSGIILRNIKLHLGNMYNVVLANSGETALKSLNMQKPDLILLDYEMPEMNGKEVLEAIRNNPSIKDIPVFFLTGHCDREIIDSVINLHPEGYIMKDQGVEKVIKAVEAYFNNSK